MSKLVNCLRDLRVDLDRRIVCLRLKVPTNVRLRGEKNKKSGGRIVAGTRDCVHGSCFGCSSGQLCLVQIRVLFNVHLCVGPSVCLCLLRSVCCLKHTILLTTYVPTTDRWNIPAAARACPLSLSWGRRCSVNSFRLEWLSSALYLAVGGVCLYVGIGWVLSIQNIPTPLPPPPEKGQVSIVV